MVRWAALLFLAGSATAGESELQALFDPINPRFELEPYDQLAFRRLPPRERILARGLAPDAHHAPPEHRDAIAQAHNIRHLLFAGFQYRKRLANKQDAFRSALRRARPETLVDLLGRMQEWSPEEFRQRFHTVGDRYDSKRQAYGQPVQALRHSERQFHRWVCAEIARRLNEMGPAGRARPLDGIIGGLDHSDASYRRRCAVVLAQVNDPLAASAIERAVDTEEDARVLATLVEGRRRHGGGRLALLFAEWADSKRDPVRGAVIRTCSGLDDAWVERLLFRRRSLEYGRLLDDVDASWPAGKWKPESQARIRFYGLSTHSRRIVFCIDVSRSMLFPMDGMGGKRELRIKRTRRELLHTLSELPPDTRFNIVMFGAALVPWQRRLVPATPENRDAAIRFIEEQPILNGTSVYGPLDFALRSDADTIFLLSDGEPNNGAIIDPALIVEEIADRNAHLGARIHVIGLSIDQNAELLLNIALRNGGRYVGVR